MNAQPNPGECAVRALHDQLLAFDGRVGPEPREHLFGLGLALGCVRVQVQDGQPHEVADRPIDEPLRGLVGHLDPAIDTHAEVGVRRMVEEFLVPALARRDLCPGLGQLEHALLELPDQALVVQDELADLGLRRPRGGWRQFAARGRFHHLLDRGHEVLWRRWLAEVPTRSQLQSELLVSGLGVRRGVDDEGDVPHTLVTNPLPAEREAVHHRHQQIADHTVGWAGPSQVERLLTVAGLDHAMPVPLEQGPEHVPVFSHVIDHEDLAHRPPLPERRRRSPRVPRPFALPVIIVLMIGPEALPQAA